MKKMKTLVITTGLFILFSVACTKENNLASISAVPQSAKTAVHHYIGESFGGGIVFYVDSTRKHGLIAYPQDFEEPSVWSYKDTITNAKATRLGGGSVNTRRIVVAQGNPVGEAEGYAALEVEQFIINGYQDWYLPSKDELNELYRQQKVIGGFKPFAYWSSSEIDVSTAWFQNFSNGVQVKSTKLGSYGVRAIRAF